MKEKSTIRLALLIGIGLILIAMPLLGACTKEVVKEVPIEKVVEKEVVKEVPVEKVVVKEIVKEVPVEKVVVKEVEVGTVTIGGVYPMSGGAASVGIGWDRGLKLAVDEINARGGIDVAGKKYYMKAESYDDEYNPAKSVAGLRKLKLLYDIPVVQMMMSGSSLAVLEINEELGVLWLGLAANPRITELGNKLVLRMPAVGKLEVGAFANVAVDIFGKAEFAIMADTGDWGRSQEAAFREVVTEHGAKVVASEWFAEATDTDFYPQLTKIKAKNPAAIYTAAHDEVAMLITKQAREIGITAPLIFPMGCMTPQARGQLDPKLIEGYYVGVSNWDLMGPEVKRYIETYDKKYGEKAPVYSGCAWEGTWIAALAMQKAGTVTDAYKIRDAALQVIPLPEDISVMREERFDPVTGQGYWWTGLAVIKDGKIVPPK